MKLYQRLTTGAGEDELVLGSKTSFRWPTDWSPDGQIAIQSRGLTSKFSIDIEAVSVADWKATTLLSTPFDERTPQFSPDGRWVAYVSDESGRFEVYVQPFPGEFFVFNRTSVEAAGVEPASRRDQRGASPCAAPLPEVAGRPAAGQRGGPPAP